MKAGYTEEKMILDKVTVYGMLVTPKSVTVNSKGAQFQYNSSVKVTGTTYSDLHMFIGQQATLPQKCSLCWILFLLVDIDS